MLIFYNYAVNYFKIGRIGIKNWIIGTNDNLITKNNKNDITHNIKHNIKHNNTKHNNTKHNNTKHNNTKHNNTKHNNIKPNYKNNHKNNFTYQRSNESQKSLKFSKFPFNPVTRLQAFLVTKFINILMVRGKKDKAVTLFKMVLFSLFLAYKKYDPYKLLLSLFFKIKLLLRLKKKKIAGRIHYIPLFLTKKQQLLYGLKIFIHCSRARLENGIIKKIVTETRLIFKNDANSMLGKKKFELYNQAVDNKYYVKYL